MAKMKTSLQPWLSVNNSAKAGAFYQAAFGAMETYRMEAPDGGLLQLSVDGAGFWVSGNNTATATPHEEALGGNSLKMILTVDDPDSVFAQTLRAGAKEVFAVGEAYGWRLGRVSDPFGLDWEIGKPLHPES